ncbi:putative response regulatory protein [compost metagenome]
MSGVVTQASGGGHGEPMMWSLEKAHSIGMNPPTASYRVLIADDEPIIREGIREAIPWSELGMEVVGEAEDGEEALELARELDIHIMLVDLNMPFLNGIELIRRLQEECPDCRCLIISGHDEFAYAQEAVRLGVQDYLLKPVDDRQLYETLSGLRQRMDEELARSAYVEQTVTQLERHIPLLRSRCCLEWLEGFMEEPEVLEQLGFLSLPPHLPVQIGLVRWPGGESQQSIMQESERQLLRFGAENIMGELLTELPHVLFQTRGGLVGMCLWQIAPEGLEAEIEQKIGSFLNIAVHCCLETNEDGLVGLREAYRHCREQLQHESQVSPLVRRARQLIRERYAQRELTLDSLAASLQVSPVYLSRVLKKELNENFVTLVTRTRIRKAVQLLDSTLLPIHAIAEQTGYDSQHYFSTAFKKIMGVSPAQYRRGGSRLPSGNQ